MDCNIFKIANNIGACTDKTTLGYNRLGYWALYDDIDQSKLTIDGTELSELQFVQFHEIYDGSDKPFDGTTLLLEKSSKHGYPLINQTVKFPLREDTVANSLLVSALSRGQRVVIILNQKGIQTAAAGKYPIFGISGGLILNSAMSEKNADAAWEIELIDRNVSNELLFLDTDTDDLVYIRYSDGTIENDTGQAPLIDSAPVGGAVTIAYKKDITDLYLSDSDFEGNMNFVFGNLLFIKLDDMDNMIGSNINYVMDYLITQGEVPEIEVLSILYANSPDAGKISTLEGLGWTVNF